MFLEVLDSFKEVRSGLKAALVGLIGCRSWFEEVCGRSGGSNLKALGGGEF